MFGNTWRSRKIGGKFLFDLVIFSMYFLAGINTKDLWNIPDKKYFATLNVLYTFIKSLVSPFVVIDLIFFDSRFNSFSASTCFVLFEVKFLFNFFSWSSKHVFFTKLAISILLAKFACANLEGIFAHVNLLNSWVVIYLS